MDKFHISDFITASTGRFLSLGGMESFIKLVNYLVGYPVYTHQLRRMLPVIQKYVNEQLPQLTSLHVGEISQGNIYKTICEWEKTFGKELSIPPMPDGLVEQKDSLQELIELIGDKENVIIVDASASNTKMRGNVRTV